MTPTPKATVLFLCTHNAGRSQMALGWLRQLGGDRVVGYSAGSAPGNAMNPRAVDVMTEVGIDITGESPKRWTEEMLAETDVVVLMGCGDACPVYPGKRYVDWPLDDPAGGDLDMVRRVRDEIRVHVVQLLRELNVDPTPNTVE